MKVEISKRQAGFLSFALSLVLEEVADDLKRVDDANYIEVERLEDLQAELKYLHDRFERIEGE